MPANQSDEEKAERIAELYRLLPAHTTLIQNICEALRQKGEEVVEECARIAENFSNEDDWIFSQLDDKGAQALRIRAKYQIAEAIRSITKAK